MISKERFWRVRPNAYFLDPNDRDGLSAYLRERGWLATDAGITVEKAGEGNMNCTLRVRSGDASLIVKQSRPWVEKYPDIAAPEDRALTEARFYALVATRPALAAVMPRLIGVDEAARIIALEDLGAAQDFTGLYGGERLDDATAETLAQRLTALHESFCDAPEARECSNRAMRELNCEHIFHIPLQTHNGLPLETITPGLERVAQTLKDDAAYVRTVAELGARYLSEGRALLHGDFFPGSWLHTASGVRVIDPEFCFFGPPEFDLGVFIAHLHLANQSDATISRVRAAYRPPFPVSDDLVRKFAGVEIMRRLIGVAQPPLPYGLERKSELLAASKAWLLG
jgi:5-methylthioribose kinase